MDSTFSLSVEFLQNNDFASFEKQIKIYNEKKNSLPIDERIENYDLLKEIIDKKFNEYADDKTVFEKIYKYTVLYLNKKDYDILKFWTTMAEQFESFKMYNNAVKCYVECLKFKDFDKDIFRKLGDLCFFNKKDNLNAIKCYEQYIKYIKDNDAVYNMLGHIYETTYKSEYVDKQIYYFETAHKLAPKQKSYIKNLALVAGKNKDIGRFCKYSDMIMKRNPTHQEKFDFACWSLYNKIFKNMHKYYHSRFYKKTGATPYPDVDNKYWDGKTSLADKTLLIRYEQGFGDSICFVRFIPLLKDIAPNLIFMVQKSLFSLFKYNYPEMNIVDDKKRLKNIKYDFQIPLMDLFSILKITDKTIPQKDGYLTVSDKEVQNFAKENIKTKKFKIGISYKGSPMYHGDSRDIPEEILAKLTSVKNAQIYSLQVEGNKSFLELPECKDVKDLSGKLTDFEKTAAAMKNMDLIISSDNVILNLAGAMGLKTFGLFNYYTDFRWFTLKGNDSGWYNSVKVYRAKKYNDWETLMNTVTEDVQKLADEYTSSQ